MALLCIYNCIRGITGRIVYGGACLVIVPSTVALLLIGHDILNTSYLPFVTAIGLAGAAVVTYKCVCRDCEDGCNHDHEIELRPMPSAGESSVGRI